MNKRHATYGKASFMGLPLFPLGIPSEFLRKILIEVVVGFRDVLIGLEPCCELGILIPCTFQNIIGFIVCMEVDHLLILEMDREVIDGRLFHVHWKLKDVPACFDRTNVTTINIILNLIDLLVLAHLYSGKIVALVDILVNILYGLDRRTNLDIDAAVILGREIWAIRDNITIVKDVSTVGGVGATIVWPGIFWVTIFSKAGFLTKVLPIILAAFVIDHAWRIGVFRTTGTMEHALCYSFIQHGMSYRIRKLSRDNAVDLICIGNFVVLPKGYEQMDGRQITLLELHGIDQASYLTKEALSDILQQSLHFLTEDTGNNVRTI